MKRKGPQHGGDQRQMGQRGSLAGTYPCSKEPNSPNQTLEHFHLALALNLQRTPNSEPREKLPPGAGLSLREKPEHAAGAPASGKWARGRNGDLFETFKVLSWPSRPGSHLLLCGLPHTKLRHQTRWIRTSSPSCHRAFALFPHPEHWRPSLTPQTPVLTSLPQQAFRDHP